MEKKHKYFLIPIILIVLYFLIISPNNGYAYYGSLLGIRPFYGGNLYGIGGLYGMGLYGLGGLYGLSGLNSGLYGLALLGLNGGLSGLSQLFGLGGFYAPYSSIGLDILGMTSLIKSLNKNTNTIVTPIATKQALLPLTPLSLPVASPVSPLPVANILGTTILPVYIAEQAGTWVGQWIAVDSVATGIFAGNMTLDIVEAPFISGAVTGFAVLELNAFLGGGVSLTGTASNNIVTLKGSVQTTFGPKPLTVDIICTLNLPTHMTGTYQVADFLGGSVKIFEVGTFKLELLPALIL